MINDVLSKKMQVKPLKEGEVAIYRLLGAGMPSLDKKDEYDNPIPNMPTLMLSAQEYVIDPENPNGRVLIEHTEGGRYIDRDDGSRFFKPNLKKIKIVGTIAVNHHNPETYYFLERSNKNKNNIFRDPKVKVRFERVLVEKEVRDEVLKLDMIDMAVRIVKEGDMADLRFIAKNLPERYTGRVNFDKVEEAKLTLRKIALEDPKAIIMGGDNSKNKNVTLARKLIQLEEAEKWHVLRFDETDRKWYFNQNGDFENIAYIFPGTNRYEGLLDALHKNEEKQKVWNKILDELEKTKTALA